jgi:hypothetical protein
MNVFRISRWASAAALALLVLGLVSVASATVRWRVVTVSRADIESTILIDVKRPDALALRLHTQPIRSTTVDWVLTCYVGRLGPNRKFANSKGHFVVRRPPTFRGMRLPMRNPDGCMVDVSAYAEVLSGSTASGVVVQLELLKK